MEVRRVLSNQESSQKLINLLLPALHCILALTIFLATSTLLHKVDPLPRSWIVTSWVSSWLFKYFPLNIRAHKDCLSFITLQTIFFLEKRLKILLTKDFGYIVISNPPLLANSRIHINFRFLNIDIPKFSVTSRSLLQALFYLYTIKLGVSCIFIAILLCTIWHIISSH